MQLTNILFAAVLAAVSINASPLPNPAPEAFWRGGHWLGGIPCERQGQSCHAKRDPAAVAEAIAKAGESVSV